MLFKTTAGTIVSVKGQLKAEDETDFGAGVFAGVEGYIEIMDDSNVLTASKLAAVHGEFDVTLPSLTIDSGGIAASFFASVTGAGTATQSSGGILAAFYAEETITSGAFGYGLYLKSSAATIGISIGTATTVLVAREVGTSTTGWLLQAGVTATHLVQTEASGAIQLFIDCSATSGSNRTIFVETLTSANGALGNYGARFASGLKTGVTSTSGAWNIGVQGKVVSAGVHVDGTTSAAVLAQLNSTGTWQSGAVLYGVWIDSQLAATPANGGAGGNWHMLGITTSQGGTVMPTSMIYAFGGAEAAFDFNNFSEVEWCKATSTVSTHSGYIVCTIDGSKRYLRLFTTLD